LPSNPTAELGNNISPQFLQVTPLINASNHTPNLENYRSKNELCE